ncbi:hypothetical protein WMY93_033392 [Mugilogobius chulae]|uniref:Uncharacterized protein n=1 Tax=Mugilogobius chulae TaxID=88201 RepID=A0AAW0MU04_9GOBI
MHHCERENDLMDWDDTRVIAGSGIHQKHTHQTVNRDEGADQLSHTWDTVLRRSDCRWRCRPAVPRRKMVPKPVNKTGLQLTASGVTDTQTNLPRSQCTSRTWFRPGLVLIQSWFRPGLVLIQSWFRPGLVLIQSWFRPDLDLVQSWFRPDLDLVQSWFSPGSVLVQSRFRTLQTALILQTIRPHHGPAHLCLLLFSMALVFFLYLRAPESSSKDLRTRDSPPEHLQEPDSPPEHQQEPDSPSEHLQEPDSLPEDLKERLNLSAPLPLRTRMIV